MREPSTDNAWFSHVAFPGDADFEDANFTGDAGFGNVTFTGNARFSSAAFTGNAWFSDATFTHDADFDHLTFARDAQFSGARFERAPFLGPLNCGPLLNLSEAIFSVPVTIQVAAEEVRCVRTRWDATVSLRLRYAKVDLSDAVVTQPTAVTTHPHSLPEHACLGLHRRANGEDDLLARDRHSALGPDGYRPQQLRLHRSVPPRPAPPRRPYPIHLRTETGIIRHGLLPMRFTRRRTLVEEHHWRAIRTPTTNWVPRAILQHSPPNPMTWLPEALLPRRTTSRASSVSTITLLAAGDTVALHPQAA
ncbi:pentapeptide repeat-containing protein [Streptomyces sp. NPDC001455]|uniref:pentapeptide repeat-containing protein n=1 Tax=Streptomyces sp. NPDC001455 TaxID=3154518 RepID=UPI0033264890